MKNYQKPDKSVWTGRESAIVQYRHQNIKLLDYDVASLENIDAGLIGYQCDEGVRRNQGRIGAAEGPDAIRRQLAKLPLHSTKSIADLGNVICTDQAMEQCQEVFSEIAASLIRKGALSIGLGGGHDIGYAHFRGVAKSLQGTDKRKVAIINFDAHFDLRPVVDGLTNSGTPFNQILNEYHNTELDVSYMVVGIQRQSNTRELFEIAEKERVTYLLDEDCTIEKAKEVHEQLSIFIAACDALYLTIDMDAFSAAYAPGVSSSSPFGLTPDFVRKLVGPIQESSKLVAVDVAELNPKYDIDDRTSKLAARLVDLFM